MSLAKVYSVWKDARATSRFMPKSVMWGVRARIGLPSELLATRSYQRLGRPMPASSVGNMLVFWLTSTLGEGICDSLQKYGRPSAKLTDWPAALAAPNVLPGQSEP